jgi:hypothetical protein
MLSEQRKALITSNYRRVLDEIEEAREKRGGGAPVSLLGATKTVPAQEILFACDELGLSLVGENRAEEMVSKFDDLTGHAELHLIGTLQRRKVKTIADKVSVIESVDSLALCAEIDKRCEALGKKMRVLVEVNSGREENKSGVMPEDTRSFCDEIEAFPSLELAGLMTMAPICDKKDDYRKYFSQTYQIFIDIFEKKSHNIREYILSMGMSDSFVPAVLEGATEVRVGSAIFGARDYSK